MATLFAFSASADASTGDLTEKIFHWRGIEPSIIYEHRNPGHQHPIAAVTVSTGAAILIALFLSDVHLRRSRSRGCRSGGRASDHGKRHSGRSRLGRREGRVATHPGWLRVLRERGHDDDQLALLVLFFVGYPRPLPLLPYGSPISTITRCTTSGEPARRSRRGPRRYRHLRRHRRARRTRTPATPRARRRPVF